MDATIEEGSVWRVSFVRVAAGAGERYLKDVGAKRKKVFDEAIKEGLILSYKSFNGLAMGREDWDFMFMVEYPNWAAIDGMRQKMDRLNEACVGDESAVDCALRERAPIREMMGEKFVQEFHIRLR